MTVSECGICRDVLASSQKTMRHSLQNKKGETIDHIFHEACLERWFQHKGDTFCPMNCGEKFAYTFSWKDRFQNGVRRVCSNSLIGGGSYLAGITMAGAIAASNCALSQVFLSKLNQTVNSDVAVWAVVVGIAGGMNGLLKPVGNVVKGKLEEIAAQFEFGHPRVASVAFKVGVGTATIRLLRLFSASIQSSAAPSPIGVWTQVMDLESLAKEVPTAGMAFGIAFSMIG